MRYAFLVPFLFCIINYNEFVFIFKDLLQIFLGFYLDGWSDNICKAKTKPSFKIHQR